jgi:hypothetical protein
VTQWVLSLPLQRFSQTCRSDCAARSHVQRALEPLAKLHRALSSIRISLAANAASNFPSHQPSSTSLESGEVPSSVTPSLAEGASKSVPSPALVRLVHGSSLGVSKNRLSTDMATCCPVPLCSEELSFGTFLPRRCVFRPRRFYDHDGLLQRVVLLPCRAAAGPEVRFSSR